MHWQRHVCVLSFVVGVVQMTLSVIIIVLNEAHQMRDCLDTVRWADELIVLDAGSTDGTPDIAREYTPHVYETDWPGFGPQKNRALAYATGDWVLSLDADERISPELRAEITSVMASDRYDGYQMPRRSSYCGRFMRHGGWWPDYVTRLFRRGRGQFTEVRVHERVIVQGRTGTLQTPIIHYSFRDLDAVLRKVNQYSTEGAHRLADANRRAGLGTAILRGLWTFVRCYFLKAGFLDGREGFILAVSNAEGTYYRYLKLMYLQRR